MLQDAAIVREVHVFGDQLKIGEKPSKREEISRIKTVNSESENENYSGQHMGF